MLERTEEEGGGKLLHDFVAQRHGHGASALEQTPSDKPVGSQLIPLLDTVQNRALPGQI